MPVDGLAVAAAREIRRRACEPITLATIVEALPATYRTIDRHFRKAFGRSMGEELVRSRINEAARLLAETHLPLRLVADRVGYASTAYFANTFSKHTGTPPGAYRKAHHRREHG